MHDEASVMHGMMMAITLAVAEIGHVRPGSKEARMIDCLIELVRRVHQGSDMPPASFRDAAVKAIGNLDYGRLKPEGDPATAAAAQERAIEFFQHVFSATNATVREAELVDRGVTSLAAERRRRGVA
jgi:hypothetical protein